MTTAAPPALKAAVEEAAEAGRGRLGLPGPEAPEQVDNNMPPGVYVQPGEVGFVLTTQVIEGRAWVVLRLEHSTGTTSLPLPPEFARTFGLGLLDEASRGVLAQTQVAAQQQAEVEAAAKRDAAAEAKKAKRASVARPGRSRR